MPNKDKPIINLPERIPVENLRTAAEIFKGFQRELDIADGKNDGIIERNAALKFIDKRMKAMRGGEEEKLFPLLNILRAGLENGSINRLPEAEIDESVNKAIAKLDKNRDGFISRDELRSEFGNLQNGLTGVRGETAARGSSVRGQ